MSVCNNEFIELDNIYKNNSTYLQAKQLYQNATYYVTVNELTGALVSYSCAAVLFNTLKGNVPESNNSINIVTPINSQPDSQPSTPRQVNSNQQTDHLSAILTCCLKAIENLQQKVGSNNKSNNNDEEEKPWDKICTKIEPLVFKKGGSDCIFFEDVAGLFIEKKLMDESLIKPLQFPNIYPAASRGLLIYGPPGTGKTYLVKAAVNELQKKDPNVGILFFAPSPGDFKGKYVGETEKKIEEIFVCASRAACEYQNEKCKNSRKKYRSIIFMDEMDAIAPDRTNDQTGLAVNSVNTLLQMMDGIKSRPNVTVIAATNYPWTLDSAILRRFDSQIFIDVPNERDLLELLDIQMRAFINIHKNVSDMCINTSNGKLIAGCDLECERKVKLNVLGNAPYSNMKFSFFDEMRKAKGNEIKNIVAKMVLQNFSNSDLSTFMKTAQRKAGEYAVNANLFYSTKLLGYNTNVGDEIYVSSLSTANNIDIQIAKSIEIINALLDNKPINKDIYCIEIPDIITIEHNGWVYYNRKCLLCKPDIMIDDPYIKDVYVRGHRIGNNIKLNEHSYKEYILGRKLLGRKSTFVNNMLEWVKGESIDLIMTFDNITFVENKNMDKDTNQIFPKAMGILDTVVTPLVNAYKNTIENYNKATKFNQDKATAITSEYEIVDVKSTLFVIDENKRECNLDSKFNKLAESVCNISEETFLKYRHNINYLRWLYLKKCYSNPNDNELTKFEEIYVKSFDGVIVNVINSSQNCNIVSLIHKDGRENIDVCIDSSDIYIEFSHYYDLIDINGFNDTDTTIEQMDKLYKRLNNNKSSESNVDNEVENNKILKIPFLLFYNLFNDVLIMPQDKENRDIIQVVSNTPFNDNLYRLIQMLMDDILNYSSIVGDPKNKKNIDDCFKKLLKLTEITEIEIINLIIQRAYDNFLLRNPLNSVPVKVPVPEVQNDNNDTSNGNNDDDDDDYKDANDNKGGGTLSKIKSKSKSISKTRSKLFKRGSNKTVKKYYVLPDNTIDNNKYGSIHIYDGGNEEHNSNGDYTGGVVHDVPIYGGNNYEKFLEWTVKDNIPETTSKNIADKTAFVHTTINLDWSDVPEYTNLITIIYNMGSTMLGGGNTVKDYLNMIMKKNVLLATLFKRIDYIGFLIDKNQKNKTESDNVIISRNKGNMSNINISWGEIDSRNLKTTLSNFLSIFRGNLGQFINSLTDTYTSLEETLSSIPPLVSAMIGTIPTVIMDDGLTKAAFALYEPFKNETNKIYLWLAEKVNWFIEYIQTNFPTLTMPLFLTNAASFVKQVLLGGWNTLSYAGLTGLTIMGNNIILTIFSFIFVVNIAAYVFKSNITDEEIINNVIVNQIYTMVRDIKVFEVDSLDKPPCSLFGKIIDDSQNFNIKMLPIIKNFFINKEISSIVKGEITFGNIESSTSKNSLILSKEKLINVEIPLSAFYYSLLNTRSTYPKELAQDLKEYNQDKDAFMMKLKKKREKNK